MSRAREFADLAGSADAGGLTGRNILINGAMQVAQRATAATAVSGAGVYDTIDRLKLWESTDGAFTSEQSTESPDGFSNSVKLAVTTADSSLAADQYACIAQIVEAQNLQHLAYGTNAAKTITFSFYVRSNKTGTYCFMLDKIDATNYHYVKEFTINSADTWERKTITIAPDSNIKAAGGAIGNDNLQGFRCFIGLAWGSNFNTGTDDVWSSNTNHYATTNQVNWMDSTSNNFYFTGFQLEVGDKATPFEHRSFADELARCQRYYFRSVCETSLAYYADSYSNDTIVCLAMFPVKMRVKGTGALIGTWAISNCNSQPALSVHTPDSVSIYNNSVASEGRAYFYAAINDGFEIDAEL